MKAIAAPMGLVRRLGAAFAALPVRDAIIGLGGAHAKGEADALSDLDFYVFCSDLPPIQSLREALVSLLPDLSGLKTWSGSGEAGIDFTLDGVPVEIWFRDSGATRAIVEATLQGGFERQDRLWTPNGFYPSTVLADLAAMDILSCADPDFLRLLERIAVYPEPLRQKIFAAGLAAQDFWQGNMHLETALARADAYYLASIHHQVRNGLIQSAFALNGLYFGGDKKMDRALRRLECLPAGFVAALLPDQLPASSDDWRLSFAALFAAGDGLRRLDRLRCPSPAPA
ncbi:hypothetical protein [Devosia faecipullorum]|uniref:hypothetical protein n=1 Tax=Devosia faecipullorum TaxID=2755039 RepID=UPI00187B7BCA|nr:hypothetical protein [Devosia faecipullorum]MBE7732582.1 hypothetical protein [Devosia faecipullorum]